MNDEMLNDLKQLEVLMRAFSSKYEIDHVSMYVVNGSCIADGLSNREPRFDYYNGRLEQK